MTGVESIRDCLILLSIKFCSIILTCWLIEDSARDHRTIATLQVQLMSPLLLQGNLIIRVHSVLERGQLVHSSIL